ncbi:L-ascorbate metabolism protein UlaG (beta-lactamase superfamily) [Gelidibacter sediminis]|uniref:L-ascorbate metabolism protein UlaG (Beta-lactamase superfamily) n=1 Tax=Gelidibacter sediminis TaxID=1608710 RepID=A0A4R7Q0H1_9FLAO|nr:MBL fold metallo-hydrolase [Gelidibacter sediminis]TDU39910.1 L-ascorbate metabolism protein UlaG (beta-lactamase superfamily) [Gelidibacter sediminis]
MKRALSIVTLSILLFCSCKNSTEKVVEMAAETADDLHKTTTPDSINIIPIEHATFILAHKDVVIYIDPVGGTEAFAEQEKPNYILITDIHGDHLDVKTLQGMTLDSTVLVVPQAVKDKLPELKLKDLVVMNNGDTRDFQNYSIEAIPMYNLRPEALKFHEKGRGNGYVLTLGGQRIYISGDTEDITEMRQLKNIDMAFVCMNLPYTMTVESAASAVLDFKPKKVYPYHFRGTEGMSDVNQFKTIINKENSDIEVVQLEWYK